MYGPSPPANGSFNERNKGKLVSTTWFPLPPYTPIHSREMNFPDALSVYFSAQRYSQCETPRWACCLTATPVTRGFAHTKITIYDDQRTTEVARIAHAYIISGRGGLCALAAFMWTCDVQGTPLPSNNTPFNIHARDLSGKPRSRSPLRATCPFVWGRRQP